MSETSGRDRLDIASAGIAELAAALGSGRVTSTELALRYLNRIARYDRQGARLNAVPELNPGLLEEARASDERRQRGEALGPLDGVPYLAKASYAVRGLPLTAGSPAFAGLVAREDAHVVARLRGAGRSARRPHEHAADGRRRHAARPVRPRREPVQRRLPAVGPRLRLVERLRRGPRGGVRRLRAGRGDVVVGAGARVLQRPRRLHAVARADLDARATGRCCRRWTSWSRTRARSADLLALLDVLVGDDAETRGDLWRAQRTVALPAASSVRPASFAALLDPSALAGRRVGAPRMYLGRDPGSTRPVPTRPSMLELWERAAAALRGLGAEVVEVDFPLVSGYDLDRPGARSMVERGLVPAGFAAAEGELVAWAWDDYLRANADPTLASLADVDGAMIFPRLPSELPDRYEGIPDFATLPAPRAPACAAPEDLPDLAAGLAGLEEVRRRDLEAWMDAEGLDCLAFPALADVAPADADRNVRSADLAWRNGTWVANGNQAIRHHGVPTVTVPMGMLADIGMPAGLTFAGRGYDDAALLRYAGAFEAVAPPTAAPPRTPPLPGDAVPLRPAGGTGLRLELDAAVSPVGDDGLVEIAVEGRVAGGATLETVELLVDGEPIEVRRDGDRMAGAVRVPLERHYAVHSPWRRPYGSLVTAFVRDADGRSAAAYRVVGGI